MIIIKTLAAIGLLALAAMFGVGIGMLEEKHGEKWKVYNFTEGEGIKNYVVTHWHKLPKAPWEEGKA